MLLSESVVKMKKTKPHIKVNFKIEFILRLHNYKPVKVMSSQRYVVTGFSFSIGIF